MFFISNIPFVAPIDDGDDLIVPLCLDHVKSAVASFW
jgi:hypothetical protein